MVDVVMGRIAKLGDQLIFTSPYIATEIQPNPDIKVGDIVVGYIKKVNLSRKFYMDDRIVSQFHLIAKTTKGKVHKPVIMKAVINFVKLRRDEMGLYTKWASMTPQNIFSRKRNLNLVYTRHLYMFLCRFMTNKTLKAIAKECKLTNDNHTTVMNAEKQVLNRLSINLGFAASLQQLVDECKKD